MPVDEQRDIIGVLRVRQHPFPDVGRPLDGADLGVQPAMDVNQDPMWIAGGGFNRRQSPPHLAADVSEVRRLVALPGDGGVGPDLGVELQEVGPRIHQLPGPLHHHNVAPRNRFNARTTGQPYPR